MYPSGTTQQKHRLKIAKNAIKKNGKGENIRQDRPRRGAGRAECFSPASVRSDSEDCATHFFLRLAFVRGAGPTAAFFRALCVGSRRAGKGPAAGARRPLAPQKGASGLKNPQPPGGGTAAALRPGRASAGVVCRPLAGPA